jgi:hypothetical protein
MNHTLLGSSSLRAFLVYFPHRFQHQLHRTRHTLRAALRAAQVNKGHSTTPVQVEACSLLMVDGRVSVVA